MFFFIIFKRNLLLLQLIKEIMAAVTIPVFAKVRIGHFAEAQILEALGVDMIDESEGTKTTLDYLPP